MTPWGMHGVGTRGAGITDGWHHCLVRAGWPRAHIEGAGRCIQPTVDHTQCSEGVRIVRGCEEWLCVHMAECHWPELEVWCKDRLRVCGSVRGSVRGGGGDGRRVPAAAMWCGAGDGQGKE